MQPSEALDLINRVTSTFSGTRQDHVQIQDALQVLEHFIQAKHVDREQPENGPTDTAPKPDNSEESIGISG